MSKSFAVPSSEIPGYSAIYRHPEYKDGTHDGKFADITTVYELFAAYVNNNPKSEFLGTRKYLANTNTFGKYEWLTTTEVAELVNDFGSGLDNIYSQYAPELNPVTGQQPLGIFSLNRYEWNVSEFSAFRSRRYTVGITDTTGVELSEYGINEAGVKVIICSIDKIPRMLDRIKLTPTLKVIISMDKFDCTEKTFSNRAFSKASIAKLQAKAESLGISLFDMGSVVNLGRATPTEPTLPKFQDYCTLCFSSGTTGTQKGVLITHQNFIYSSRAAIISDNYPEGTYLSYMSLSHVFERYLLYSFMNETARIGYFTGDIANLLEDMQALRPTVFATAPVLLNRIYNKLASATIGVKGIRGVLLNKAVKSKINQIKSGNGYRHGLWDKLVFDKIAALFGGNLKIVISGAYFLHEDVQNFLRACLSCNVIQGYGQTETSGGCTLQSIDDISSGNIGIPLPGIDVRLRSIPEMGYNVTDSPCPRGELMICSESVFKCYYNEPERTAETMDGEWLATGDIVAVNPDGTISILERIKNIFKSGLNIWIEPEALETIYNTHSLVDSSFVYSNDEETELVAVIVPDPEHFVSWAQAIIGNKQVSINSICTNEKVVECMIEQLKLHAVKNNIIKAGIISLVHLEPAPFSKVNPEFITPSFKIRRHPVTSHYKPIFDAMFKRLGTSNRPQFGVSDQHAED